jgi:O-antigen ligase
METSWSNFYVAAGGAAAALTGLLFIAVSLRPREIRDSPLMVGRARSAFHAFAAITFVALLALAGTASRWVGLAEIGVAVGIIAVSAPFTGRARRAGQLNLRRAIVYHAGLVIVATGGLLRAIGGSWKDYSPVTASGTLLLLAIAISNSWQLVISHESDA